MNGVDSIIYIYRFIVLWNFNGVSSKKKAQKKQPKIIQIYNNANKSKKFKYLSKNLTSLQRFFLKSKNRINSIDKMNIFSVSDTINIEMNKN